MSKQKYMESLNLGEGSIIEITDNNKVRFLRLASENDVCLRKLNLPKGDHKKFFIGSKIAKTGKSMRLKYYPIEEFKNVVNYEKPIDLSFKVKNVEAELLSAKV